MWLRYEIIVAIHVVLLFIVFRSGSRSLESWVPGISTRSSRFGMSDEKPSFSPIVLAIVQFPLLIS
ncbi:uncharacterized protein BDW43DRAFT_264812 [Aspergillus alliaceus]|uniref:uncharacterized protein n=1 Tax=Petromyces alliaceus TaxID=209559 RepID=UPI0012A773E7|nr:uncharacterized protein BDW43DRAFT_264812 [Aspergillus alliaceus]KAB8237187.1 hypothetical protein BDW43DRAFT_264812 [Aspergillus alliaceus]